MFESEKVQDASDTVLATSVSMLVGWALFHTLQLTDYERSFVKDAPGVWANYGGFTWRQRNLLREVLVKVGRELERRNLVAQARQEMWPKQQRGTDGRGWHVEPASGQRWRISDELDGIPGCYVEDDMRTPAKRAWDEAKERYLRDRDLGFGIGHFDDNTEYHAACAEFARKYPEPP